MRTRIHLVAGLLLAVLWANGCSKGSSRNSNANGQSTAQAANDSEVQDNLPPSQGAQSQASSQAAEQAPAPASIVIPAGTSITVRLQQRVSSASASPGQRFEAVLEQPLVDGDRIVLPTGTEVEGHVVSAHHSGRLHHPGELGLTLDYLIVDQRRIPLSTSEVVADGGSHKKRNWGWIGGGTGGGAVIGALAAGGKVALIGSGIGAAAGTTTAFVTGKKDATFHNERLLRFRLEQDVTLT